MSPNAAGRIELCLGPARTSGRPGAIELLGVGSEYVRALALVERGRVPLDVTLHLYAYELLERLREQEVRAREAASGSDTARTVVALPFWPASLFAAAGVEAHAAVEIEAALPSLASVHLDPWPASTWAGACDALLAARSLDLGRYTAHSESVARERGWASG